MISNGFRCVLCRSGESVPFLEHCTDTYLQKPILVDYRQCGDCGLVQQYPMPNDISPFYKSYPVHMRRGAAYSRLRRWLLSGVYLPPKRWPAGARLLDFGCGDGWYLHWCCEQGLNPVGFEFSPAYAAALSASLGVEVLADLEVLTESYVDTFDVITLHFVVEHLTDFVGVLKRLASLLRPGGVLRYVVPVIDSWEYRLFGRHWHSLDAPRHVVFPSAQHAAQLARNLGLAHIDTQAVPFPNGIAGSLATLSRGQFNPGLFALAFPLGWLAARAAPAGNLAVTWRRPPKGA